SRVKGGKTAWSISPPMLSPTSRPVWSGVHQQFPAIFSFGIRSARIAPCRPKGFRKKVERYAKAAGIEASYHSFRHTFASNLLEEGAEVVSIKELLGHSSIESSERYAKLSNQRVKQVYLNTIKKVINKTRV